MIMVRYFGLRNFEDFSGDRVHSLLIIIILAKRRKASYSVLSDINVYYCQVSCLITTTLKNIWNKFGTY
jgi:hypothetical protein